MSPSVMKNESFLFLKSLKIAERQAPKMIYDSSTAHLIFSRGKRATLKAQNVNETESPVHFAEKML